MGVYSVHLVGESHYQEACAAAKFRDVVVLVPEPDNRHDPRAVRALDARGCVLGYVPRDHWLQRVVADEGRSVEARVAEILGGEPDAPMLGVVLHVRTGADAEPRAGEGAEVAEGQGQGVKLAQVGGQPKKRGCGFYAGVGAGVLVALIILGALINPAPDSAPGAGSSSGSQVVLEATAKVLADSYEANEVSAQRIYGNMPIRVTGTIEAVELDLMDEPVVRLETGQMFRWVSAHFDDSQATATASLRKGQEVTLRCAQVQEVLGSPQLEDCVVE